MNIKLITGVMGAGKSEQLIEDIKYFKEQMNKRAIVAKMSIEQKEKSGKVESRSGKTAPCLVLNIAQSEAEVLASLSTFIYDSGDVDFLFIDEAQFMTKEQINAVETAARIFNLDIRFYGLVTDFSGKLFDGAEWLLNIVDDVYVIPAECENDGCEEDAVQNARIVNGKVVIQGKQLVEDKQVYKALCASCFKHLQ